MAIEIISQSLKDEIEIQKSISKNNIWNFPAIQDERSKKDLPDHKRYICRESKCLISDFDNNKGTFQIFSEDSERITGASLSFFVSLENIHNIYAKKSKKPMKNGAQEEDSKKVLKEDSTEDFKEDSKGESKIGNGLPTFTNKDIFDLAKFSRNQMGRIKRNGKNGIILKAVSL